MTAEQLQLETIKEAFYRTLSGQGEMWFSYFDDTEVARRSRVHYNWNEFLEHVQNVREGKPFDPPKKGWLKGPSGRGCVSP